MKSIFTCCIITVLGVFGQLGQAAEGKAQRDPNFIVNVWEKEFKEQTYTDSADSEKAYVKLLEKIKDYLSKLGIVTKIDTNYQLHEYGTNRLTVLPIPQQDPHHLNQVAFDLSQEGFDLQYWPKKNLFYPFKNEGILLVRQASKKWYFNGNTLQNLAFLAERNIFEQNIAIIGQQNFDPLVAQAVQGYIFGHKHYDQLSVDLRHPLPYLAIMLDRAKNIYVPHITGRQKYTVPGTLAFNNYRSTRKLGDFSANFLKKFNNQDHSFASNLFQIKAFYFSLLENTAMHIINLNAALYIALEVPTQVHYRQDRHQSQRICVFINPGNTRNDMSYFFNIPWPGTILENGDVVPWLTSPEFQIFYRYHLDLYYRLLAIFPFALNAKIDPVAFLQALADLENHSPNLIGEDVRKNPWDLDQLRSAMLKAQNLAIDTLTKAKKRHDRYNEMQKKRMHDCAKNVLPPNPIRTKLTP